VGQVYGQTTPSVTGVEVIGEMNQDYAVNVHFEELNAEFWFAPELVEFMDHGTGTTITLDGIKKKWVRNKDGGWDEFDVP
jgi:hypothetical protein